MQLEPQMSRVPIRLVPLFALHWTRMTSICSTYRGNFDPGQAAKGYELSRGFKSTSPSIEHPCYILWIEGVPQPVKKPWKSAGCSWKDPEPAVQDSKPGKTCPWYGQCFFWSDPNNGTLTDSKYSWFHIISSGSRLWMLVTRFLKPAWSVAPPWRAL